MTHVPMILWFTSIIPVDLLLMWGTIVCGSLRFPHVGYQKEPNRTSCHTQAGRLCDFRRLSCLHGPYMACPDVCLTFVFRQCMM